MRSTDLSFCCRDVVLCRGWASGLVFLWRMFRRTWLTIVGVAVMGLVCAPPNSIGQDVSPTQPDQVKGPPPFSNALTTPADSDGPTAGGQASNASLTIGNSDGLSADDDLVRLEEKAVKQAVSFIAPSVVMLETIGGSQGSGVSTAICVSESGLFLTSAYNLRDQPSSIFIKAASKPVADGANLELTTRRFIAQVVATDHSRNLMLLKTEADDSFPFFPISLNADNVNVRPGETVIAVGKIYDDRVPNLSVGIVSALGRVWSRAIQTDAKISRANYGGPLITLQGDVVGLLCPLSPGDESVEAGAEWYDSGIGFAVPLADYESRIDQMASGKDLYRGQLGVSLKGPDQFVDLPIIAHCQPNSPASEAGLMVGDRLLAIDDTEIENLAQMRHLLGPKFAGDEVGLRVSRGDQVISFNATLTDKIDPFIELAIGIVPRSASDEKGQLEIGHVFPGSPAEKAGLKIGQMITAVDGAEVESWEEFQSKLNQFDLGDSLVLQIAKDANGGADGDDSADDDQVADVSVDLVANQADPPSQLSDIVEVPNDEEGKSTLVEVQVADSANRCFAIVPDNDFDAVGKPALLVWVAEPGVHDFEGTLNATAKICQQNNLVLLVPESLDQTSWSPGENEFIAKAVQRFKKKVDFDSSRVAIAGEKTAGAMAALTAFTNREQFQGLVMFDTSFTPQLPNVKTYPTERLLIYTATSPEFKSVATLDKIIELLKTRKFPIYRSPDSAGRLIEIFSEVARWTRVLHRR